jgi:hypothetical protein
MKRAASGSGFQFPGGGPMAANPSISLEYFAVEKLLNLGLST